MRFFMGSLLWPAEFPLNSSPVVLLHPLHTPHFGTIHGRAEDVLHSVVQAVDEDFEQYWSQY